MHLCAFLLSADAQTLAGFQPDLCFSCQVKPRLRQELVEGRPRRRTGTAIKLFLKPGMCCFMQAEMEMPLHSGKFHPKLRGVYV